MGFSGQSFDFNGVVGRSYSLIKDIGIDLRAKFSTAYTTSLTLDTDINEMSMMRPEGSWISDMALATKAVDTHDAGELWTLLEVSVRAADASVTDLLCSGDVPSCFMSGSIKVR